ncbi:uncharacterized protein LTR77_001205 [Saxophila tyrrhenica]|uniref:F-box domain-containing protein n=1 Tax=Saxophila tyrrhenica TaxID=1690608 RepID=A0AAV9PKE8_9PEZI|nr:hypothetical protein LTR77_001205 [Saxophila tyrrhenica]
MDYSTPDPNSWPARLVTGIGRRLRSNKAFREETIRSNEARAAERRQKAAERHAEKYRWTRQSVDSRSNQDDVNELGERDYSVFSQATTLVSNKDNTDMLHRLAHYGSFDSLVDQALEKKIKDPLFDSQDPKALEPINALSELHMRQVAALPEAVWENIASFLEPADAACLSLASKVLQQKLGFTPLKELDQEENRHQKIAFLHRIDKQFPDHLLCFPCAKFHLRSTPRRESLKADYVANPLFTCPNTRGTYLPRMRLVHGRELPYSFVQLAVRGHKHSSAHGIELTALERKWKCKSSPWTHRTRYLVNNSRLLMRVVSQAYAQPSAETTETSLRHLLYDREEYTPFFSVCAHWRDGELMRLCKCALSHVPSPPQSYSQQLKKAPKINRALANPTFIVRGCDDCQPARRCPECPTEYLIEVQMVEDKSDPVRQFKHAIVVTRWSDLGDGSSPYTSPEWTAIQGSSPEVETKAWADELWAGSLSRELVGVCRGRGC